MVDYYQVLGVKHTASSKEIKAAYKRLARLQHPDLNGGSAEAAQAFVQLSHARNILLDPKSRAEYDAQRHAAAPGPGAYAAVLKPTGENYLRRARSAFANLSADFITIETGTAASVKSSFGSRVICWHSN